MDTVVFNKEDFKKSVLDNVKNIYRKNIPSSRYFRLWHMPLRI